MSSASCATTNTSPLAQRHDLPASAPGTARLPPPCPTQTMQPAHPAPIRKAPPRPGRSSGCGRVHKHVHCGIDCPHREHKSLTCGWVARPLSLSRRSSPAPARRWFPALLSSCPRQRLVVAGITLMGGQSINLTSSPREVIQSATAKPVARGHGRNSCGL